MGYKPESKLYKVVFTDKPGLEIFCKGASVGKLMSLQGMQLNLNEADPEKKTLAFKYFASRIVRWTMEHPDVEDEETDLTPEGKCVLCGQTPGGPLLPTVKGLMCLEISEIMGIIFGYMSAIAQVTPGKEPNGNVGESNIREEVMRQLGEMQSPLTSLPPNLFSEYSNVSATHP
jgi:hypothetical protein